MSAAAAALATPLAYTLSSRTERVSKPSNLVRDRLGTVDLPPGFTYRILGTSHERMSDGYSLPEAPDGMACFAGSDGTWVLMRNHELETDPSTGPGWSAPPPEAFDGEAQGGVSRVVLDPSTLEIRSQNLVVAGTLRNCAGGPSPWGWLTCEETTEAGHGYVFACPIDASRVVHSAPIRGYGRFRHEAVAIDPRTRIAYLTEDQGDGCLYRFVPHDFNRPFEGRLQAMRVQGEPRYSTSEHMSRDRRVEVDWVDIAEPDPNDDSVRHQAAEAGAAEVRRGEGIWYADGSVYISSTSGGLAGKGQIFRLELSPHGSTQLASRRLEGLDLVAEADEATDFDGPDNITVAPWGDVVIAEDGSNEQYVRCIHGNRVIDIARNARSRSEITGVCFSPDGSTLFFNLQRDGLTIAVRGDFDTLLR